MWCKGLSLEKWQEQVATVDEYAYLHGFCNDWAYENYKEGDKILLLYALDDEFKVEHLIHCCLIRNGLYLDVRGETDDFEKVLEDFEDFIIDDYTETVICSNLNEFMCEMNNLGITME